MENKKPLAVIHEISKGKCTFTGKTCECAIVSFADGSIRRQHLSWSALRKLLEFQNNANSKASSGEATDQSKPNLQAGQ